MLLGVLRKVLDHVPEQILVDENGSLDMKNIRRKLLRCRWLEKLAGRYTNEWTSLCSLLDELLDSFWSNEVLLWLESRIAETLFDHDVRSGAEALGKWLNEHIGVVHPINSALVTESKNEEASIRPAIPQLTCRIISTYDFMTAQVERRIFAPIQTIAVHLRHIERVFDKVRLVLLARDEHERFVDKILRSFEFKL